MRRRAFTLTEVLLAMIVVGIVGAALTAALFSFLNSYNQTEDYTKAREEIESAFQVLSSQFSNVGLGMPNNTMTRGSMGSFVAAFASHDDAPVASVMSLMGGVGWGGPITVTNGEITDSSKWVTTLADGCFSGKELYYAWSIPTGVLVSSDFGALMAKPKKIPDAALKDEIVYMSWISQDIGYWGGDTLQLKKNLGGGLPSLVKAGWWLTFPSFGVPVWVKSNATGKTTAIVAPGALKNKNYLGGVLYGFEEVHHVRAARLLVLSGDLVQELYEAPPQAKPSRQRVLAHGVAGAWFRFYPGERLLTLDLAVLGVHNDSRYASGKRPPGWPSSAPEIGDGKHRILVESMTWRIRN